MKIVKRIAVLTCLCLVATAALGAKLSQSVPNGWSEDFEAAKALAEKDGKLVLLAFSGSDWCGWCMKMEREIFSNKKFVTRAKKDFVLVMIDNPSNKNILSPLAKKQNQALAQQYGISGYPCTVIVKPSGEEVKRFTGYQKGGVKPFLAELEATARKAKAAL